MIKETTLDIQECDLCIIQRYIESQIIANQECRYSHFGFYNDVIEYKIIIEKTII